MQSKRKPLYTIVRTGQLSTTVSIGPLIFELHGNQALPESLLAYVVKAGGATVRCQCRQGPVPPVREQRVIVESGGIWCLERMPAGVRLVLRLGGPGGRTYQQLLVPDDGTPARATIDPGLLGPEQPQREFALREPLWELWACRLLADRAAVLLHAAAVGFGDELWLFAGQSGAGKSTLCRLLDDAGVGRVLCDDRVIAQLSNGSWQAWSTPWHGEAGFSRPGRGGLGRIFFLHQAASCRTSRLTPADGLARLLGCVFSLEWSARDIERLMDLGGKLLARVPAYLLEFTPDESLVGLLHQAAAEKTGR